MITLLPSRGQSHFLRSHLLTVGLFLILLCSFLLPEQTSAQQESWRFDSIRTVVGFDLPHSYNPQVALDRWGVSHLAWVTRDPNSAGLQILYSNDATNRRGAPFLLTDSGTVFDSLKIDTTSYHMRVDRDGYLHIGFVANVMGSGGLQIGLYYATNRGHSFLSDPPVRITQQSARYDIAVDSSGVAHIVWLEQTGGQIFIRYWNSAMVSEVGLGLGAVPCEGNGCQFEDPQIEVRNGMAMAFIRNGSGRIWQAQFSYDLAVQSLSLLPIPAYPNFVRPRPDDLKIRAALDSNGSYYLLYPVRGIDRLVTLQMAHNVSGVFQSTAVAAADSILLGFDIQSDGTNHLAATWTGYRGRYPADRPKTGFAEFVRNGSLLAQKSLYDDLNTQVGNPRNEWRLATRLAFRNDQVEIASTRYADPAISRQRQVGLFRRVIATPRTSYMLPDAAAPGMNIVVETVAPTDAFGSFGKDGFNPSVSTLEFVQPSDSNLVVIGPSVVSWDGRLLSTILYVKPDALPSEVKFQVRSGSRVSNPQSFYIVRPQHLGPNGDGVLNGGGVLGSGTLFGTRSPRGVLVVDSLVLRNGMYTVSKNDTDPAVAGNQGLLPVYILAAKDLVIDSTATLSIAADSAATQYTAGIGGTGGSGGGAGAQFGGGIGYTAGGLPGDSVDNGNVWYRTASGNDRSGFGSGGGSLNMVRGGAGRVGAAGGGGTGHPFGASGRYGGYGINPLTQDSGGYGGGTGGRRELSDATTGGGGGGYARAGGDGGFLVHNGGAAVGSPPLVPLAGGSGGGGAWSERGASVGGGGGGALGLYSARTIHLLGTITARGGDGVADPLISFRSGGGGGSGGGVLLGAQGGIVVGSRGRINVDGGKGGVAAGGQYSNGGDGSPGRVRIDGRIDRIDSTILLSQLSVGYFGPTSDMSTSLQAVANQLISGTGIPNTKVRLYTRPEKGVWSYNRPIDVDVDTAGRWIALLSPQDVASGLVYIAVLQQNSDSSSQQWTAAPSWVMSTAGGAIIGRAEVSINVDDINFGCIPYGECRTDSVIIRNTGKQSDLLINQIEILGGSNWFLLGEARRMSIPAGQSAVIYIRFCPQDTGSITARLRLSTNSTKDSVVLVNLRGCGIAGHLSSSLNQIDLGNFCPGECRDTTVQVTNDGDAPLDISSFTADNQKVTITLLSPGLPVRINVGEKKSIRIRTCLKGGSGDNTLLLRSTTPFPSTSITIRVNDIGPRVALPTLVDAGTRDIGAGDTCRDVTFYLRNLDAQRPVRVDPSRGLTGSGFTLLDPRSEQIIGPLDSLPVHIRFCGDTAGIYFDTLRLRFSGDPCTIDTLVLLQGRIISSAPQLALDVPSDKINFGNVTVGTSSAPRTIRIFNNGRGRANNVRYALELIAPTGATEVQMSGPIPPFAMDGLTSVPIAVGMIPAAEGLRTARLVFSADYGWRDTVILCVNGIAPGIIPDTLLVDFGSLRVGSKNERILGFHNIGTALDSIAAVEIVDSIHFALLRYSSPTIPLPPVLPFGLTPGVNANRFEVHLQFAPLTTGTWSDTLHVSTTSGRDIAVVLTGVGGLERAIPDSTVIRFGCADGPVERQLRVTNGGSWTLTIQSLQLGGADPTSFAILDQPGPDRLAPGDSRIYRIAFVGTEPRADATVRIVHSGPEQAVVQLLHEECEPELIMVDLQMADRSATVGTPVDLPLILTVDAPLPVDMNFALRLFFEPTLLMPDPTLSIRSITAVDVSGSEDKPGEYVVKGRIPKGTASGEILTIPMQVLLGRVASTQLRLEVEGSKGIDAPFVPLLKNGLFTALDCDTSGWVNLGGAYSIKQSIPNPAGAQTRIDFEIARTEHVVITLYNAEGLAVATLLDADLDEGGHSLVIDTTPLGAGLYYYEIISGRYREVLRMIIVE